MDATASRAGGGGDEKVNGGEKGAAAAAVAAKKVSLLGMFRYADRLDVLLMVVGTVGALANGVADPLMTVLFGNVINSFGESTTQSVLHSVNKVVLDFVYLGIGAAVVSFLQVSCWTMAGQRQSNRIRSLYLNAVLRQDIAFFDTELTTGQAVSRMSSDTLVVQDALGEKAGKLIQLSASFFGGFIIAFTRGWLLTLVMLTSLPLIAIAGAVSAQFLTKVSSKKLTSYGDAGDTVEQTIGAIRTVVSFNGENKSTSMYKKFIKKAYRADILEGLANGFGMGSVICIAFSSYGLAFWYGGKLILDKGYTGGKVITVLIAVLIGAGSLGNATPSVSAIAEAQSAAYRLFETIERKPEIDSGDPSGVVLEDIKGDVELKDVHFRYPARPDQLILDGLSLQVASGTTMAIVGESGSGKSTVISLVERFYDPQAGEVLIDGINIKNLRVSWIREKIGLVSQEPVLFMTSIKDNIMYGKEDATLEEIKRAAELANAANFIDKLPNGYNTLVGQRGAQLSGGQKQRIAIARAIIKDPKILLLDEATSALDVESEQIVQEALNRIMVERTTLIVAHRLSTVRNVDCITVVHQGKIVEQGPHDALVKDPNGTYSQLIRLQETRADERHKIANSGAPDSRSKSTSSFLRQSMNKDSFGNGNSNRYSFNNPLGLSVELHEDRITGGQETEELSDVVALKKASIGRLFKLNMPEALVLLLGSIAASVHGVIFPLFGILISSVIKSFYEPPDKLRKDTNFWALIAVVLGVASLISIPAEYFLFAIAGGKLIERIRTLLFQSILRQEVAWFDNASNSSGALGTRLSVDALNVRRLAGDNLALIVQTIASLTTGFVIAFVADWRLALIITCVIPLVGAQGYAQVKFLKGFSENAKEMYEDASQVATDAVSSIRTIASFCAEKRVLTAYNEKCEALRKQGIRNGIVGGLGYGFSFLILYAAYGLCFYVGAQFVRQGKTTFPDVFRVFFALVLSTIGISQGSALASDVTKARDSAISIFGILDRKSKIDSTSNDGMTLDNVTGNIDFNNVSFKYPSRPDVQIFSDFTLHIPSGKTVALVGESGSGKSTIIALLERFYDPDSGGISLDGVEIKSLKVRWLRDQMGLVGQEPVLFNDTIRANITYGKHGDVTEEEVMAVARTANAHEFISSLPQGYDTMVGEKGVQLSGGQKQRVAIARAIIKDPKILLLDEATSALDAESEHIVQDALDQVMVSRTTIVVAHRLSTIKGAHMIAVLKEGKIVEKGRHEALMRIKGGAYASLFARFSFGVLLSLPFPWHITSSSHSSKLSFRDHATMDTKASTSRAAGAGDDQNSRDREGKDAAAKKVSLIGMFRYADRLDVLLMVVGTVGALANGVAEPFVTILFGNVINSFGNSSTQSILHSVSKVVLDFVYLGIVAAAVSFLQVSCWTMAGQRQSARIRSLYLNAVLRQDIAFFDTELTTGQAVSRMSSDTLVVQDALGEKAGKLIQLSSSFFGGFVIAFTRGWLLTLVMLTSLPLIAIAGAVSAQFLTKVSSQKLTSYGDAGDTVEQTIGAIRTVVSFNGENKAVAMYKKFIKKAYKTDILEGLINGFGMGSVFCILFSSYGLAFWYGGKLIVDKGYTGGKIITVLFAVLTGNATPSVSAIVEGQSAAYRLFETIERKPDIDSGDTSGIVLEDIKGDVELRDVHFRYPARPDQLILDGLSLQVTSGTTMAIVGESGSGKSTVISLVERFYDPQAGEVLIDGINIKNLKVSWIREKIGLVSQEPLLFMTSIKDNIMYGKEDATHEEIKRAAELANAANFIDKLPNGYDTLVGQRGAQLSGGQKQRIAIARAILKDPKILLLDEATSALDVESERIVQEALNRIMVERTTLVVAHRLSTVRNVDCITVVGQGKIVEQGPHDELVKDPNGAYSQLIRLQETRADERHKIAGSGVPDSRSKSTSLSLRRSMNKDSFGNSNRYSFKNPLGLSLELHENRITGVQETEELSDIVALKKAPIGRLFKLNMPEAPVLLLGSIAATVHGVIFPLFGILMSGVIKSFYQPPDRVQKDTSFWALIAIVLGVACLISIPAEYFLFAVAGGKLIKRIRTLSFQSIVRQEVAWFDNSSNSSGALGTRLSVDALNVRRLAGDNLALIVQSIASLTTGFVIAFAADWRLALIITCVIPLVGAQGYAQVKYLKGFSEDAKEMYEDASQVATDAVGSIRTVASFCAEKRVVTTYNEKCEALRKQGIRSGIVGGLGYGFSFLILYATYGLGFYVGALFVSQGKTTFPDVFRVFFALVLAAVGVSQASALAADATKASDSAISIFGILDRKSKIDSSSDDGMTLENVTGNIDFKNVSFKYPSRPDVQIFSGFTLHIPSGKTVALVGESGSGKSTIIALLERFYDPDSGGISLDGAEIKSLKVIWLRDQMGLVGQEPVLFNDTIRANITYGKHGDVTEEEIMAVAKASNAHEFISSLPQGYDTVVGEKGIQLSGGQKQRVAIARAIIKDPKILLLDEATSALDAESERIVQDALDRVMVSRTTIVVAHRLSTIKGADIIAVLKEGKIVEKGRHEALMCIKGGAYASLVELRSNLG
ncbi:hypothetical protein U9M48_018005 [Paspalum notatum var. saurae]|uniref:Uncharacterized protein n=1 Tax=Paspalum notatum var. saurae TaxID=547442 RepID=A0AAQ3TC93_PASNO